MNENCVVEIEGKKFIDIVNLVSNIKDKIPIVNYLKYEKIEVYLKPKILGRGHDSKKIILRRHIELNQLFFEGLGLWVGEGAKSKGLYFGNTSQELLLHWLKFVEEVLLMPRELFKVTIVLPKIVENVVEIKNKWSELLRIPIENFTNVSFKVNGTPSNFEYIHIYFSSIILSEIMNSICRKIKGLILENQEFSVSFLRGLFSGEGGVVLNSRSRVHHVHLSNQNIELIEFVTEILKRLGIERGKYFYESRKFPIYGKKNFEKLIRMCIFKLSTEKKIKLEEGFKEYERNVEEGKIMELKILEQLLTKTMSYTELSKNLGKGRSTIQSHYIPLLLKKELVTYIGKKERSLLFEITAKGKEILTTLL